MKHYEPSLISDPRVPSTSKISRPGLEVPFHSRSRHTTRIHRAVFLFRLAEFLLEEVVPLEPAEEDEERDEARKTEATGRRASGLPFTRVPALRTGGDLDGPRGRDTAASQPARQTSLLPGHTHHRWAQVFQLQDRLRTGPVVTQVGTVLFVFTCSFSARRWRTKESLTRKRCKRHIIIL